MNAFVVGWVLVWGTVGAVFYTAGSIGLIRMPDLRCRLHALAKADTLGLGCLAIAIAPLAETFAGGVKIVLVWVFALIAAATAARALATPEPGEHSDTGHKSGDDPGHASGPELDGSPGAGRERSRVRADGTDRERRAGA